MRPGSRTVLAGIVLGILIGVAPALDHASAQPKPIKIGFFFYYRGFS
jgi:hypothetical protein